MLERLSLVLDFCYCELNRTTGPKTLEFRISPTSHSDLLNGDEPASTLTQDFHTRLDNLLRTLVHARLHFVRCIRSNGTEAAGSFDRATVVRQIRSLQVLETVNLMASGFPHRMRFKQFNARYRMLAPFRLLRRSEDQALEDCQLILQYALEQLSVLDGSVTLAWAHGKRHVFLSEGIRQHLEHLRTEIRHKSANLMQAIRRGSWWRKKMSSGGPKRSKHLGHQQAPLSNTKVTPNSAAQSKAVVAAAAPISVPRLSAKTTNPCIGGTVARPRPQPIAGTPQEKCDQKIIQQTCNLFGLDLERPPPVPPSHSFTITGNSKVSYPQNRVMKMNFPEEGQSEAPQLKKGEAVTVVGVSTVRGHLMVEHKGQSFHVPFQFMTLSK
ncbi:uncharacterized protein LOC6528851 [Drosophila yakuba]|uniref:Myosin motor domain-containing protein n=1 Tax=Drosophila yakuba TaxID=7245 RepID=B4NX34_DROYA|nr:uncharacterized protein LOC6528851 [Drosophila yakuba]EDW89595.1 uncharacterized protein Dyak_GE19328 [Drosophila yakuba]